MDPLRRKGERGDQREPGEHFAFKGHLIFGEAAHRQLALRRRGLLSKRPRGPRCGGGGCKKRSNSARAAHHPQHARTHPSSTQRLPRSGSCAARACRLRHREGVKKR